MMISIEYKTEGRRYLSVDDLSEPMIIHADNLELYKKELKEFKEDAIASRKGIVGKNTFNMVKHKINRDKFTLFFFVYSELLQENFLKSPHEYMRSYKDTLNNMMFAVLNNSFNKDSETFKNTCKQLKIKHTYKAINDFLERI